MSISQRDVYLIHPPFDNLLEYHPFIVVSHEDANNYENTFVGVMITSSLKYKDDFSFILRNEMFEQPLAKKDNHARMHLITLFYNDEITGKRINRMKEFYFRQLMKSVGDLVFNYSFTPL